jgi:hypothetical protein
MPTEEDSLRALIVDSIAQQYSSDVKRHEDPRMKRADWFTPLDTDEVRRLLDTLWGGLVSAQVIKSAFEWLTAFGAREWPKAWCDELLDEDEHWKKLEIIDHEIECAEAHIANLKRQSNELNIIKEDDDVRW